VYPQIPDPGSLILDPQSRILNPLSRPASRAPRPASRVPRPASRVPRPASHIPRPASRIPRPASRAPRPASRIPRPASRVPRGINRAELGCMANTLEDLPIYSRAQELWGAVSAILKSPRLVRNQRLWKQIDDANDSIISNMEEGFEQPTDDAFANYLFTSKASLKEVIARLRQARSKGHIAEADLERCETMAEDLGRMLGGFIRYLYRSGFKDRGRYKLRHDTPQKCKPTSDPKSDLAARPDSDSVSHERSDSDEQSEGESERDSDSGF